MPFFPLLPCQSPVYTALRGSKCDLDFSSCSATLFPKDLKSFHYIPKNFLKFLFLPPSLINPFSVRK